MCYLINIVLSCILSYKVVFNYCPEKYLNSFTPTSYNICRICYIIFYTVFPFIFVWPLIYVASKFKPIDYGAIYFKERKRYVVNKRISISCAIVAPIFVSSIGLSTLVIYYYKTYETKFSTDFLNDAYTISRNKPNTIILYVDRGYGAYFNELIALDYLFFNKNNGLINKSGTSFVELFPEFRSFFNSISLSNITLMSNPVINGSWYFHQLLKDKKLVNAYANNMVNSEMTIDQWYLNDYLSNFKMFKKYGYQNYSLINAPYYSPNYKDWNDSWKMNQDFAQKMEGVKAIWVKDVRELLGGEDHINVQEDEAMIFQELCATNTKITAEQDNNDLSAYADKPFGKNELLKIKEIPKSNIINLSTSEDKDSTLFFFHTQVNHNTYMALEDESFRTDYNPFGINYENPAIGEITSLGEVLMLASL